MTPVQGLPEALAARLAATSRARWLGRPAEVHASLGSTQDRARELAVGGCPDGQLVWALEQTAGRGRMSRTWVSPRGKGLWFSLVLRPRLNPEAAAFLALVAGVGVARGLATITAGEVRLKWPNDVLYRGRKLGGILVEAETHDASVSHVVTGIGVNLAPGPDGWDPAIAGTAAALSEAGEADQVSVLGAMLGALELEYEGYIANGPAATRERWLALSDTIGREVSWSGPGGVIRGQAVDLDLNGALVLETPSGRRVPVAWGEIVHAG